MADQVIDTSIVIKWLVRDESFRAEARQLLYDAKSKNIRLCAPPILEYEVESVIQHSLLRKRLSLEIANASLTVFRTIDIQILEHPDLTKHAREIARCFNQNNIYDSLYAALAQIRKCDFWTADKSFYNAVKSDLSFVRYLPDYI